jgi:CheY-like chemotaxis protein
LLHQFRDIERSRVPETGAPEEPSPWQQEHPDLILMDLQMPTMDGFEATRIIRAREGSGPRTPIVALTAYSRHRDQEQAAAVGMNGFLGKPINTHKLYETVENLLRERHA